MDGLIVGLTDGLFLGGRLNGDGDMIVVDHVTNLAVDIIDRDDAQAIVNHLTAVFGLGEK